MSCQTIEKRTRANRENANTRVVNRVSKCLDAARVVVKAANKVAREISQIREINQTRADRDRRTIGASKFFEAHGSFSQAICRGPLSF